MGRSTNTPGHYLQWRDELHDDSAWLEGKVVLKVVWRVASHHQGGAPMLRIIFDDDTFLEIDHNGDDASSLETEPYDPGERHIP